MHGIFADYIVDDLNAWLQRSPEGDVSREISWEMTQGGPDNQTIYGATVRCRCNAVQRIARQLNPLFSPWGYSWRREKHLQRAREEGRIEECLDLS
jgi:hypothetical protein